MPWTANRSLFIQGAGSMYEPEGSGRLAAYLARKPTLEGSH